MESLPSARGFTLIELLVVLTIITIVTAVVITSQGSFNKSIVLQNTAYDVALTLRFAETYALGSRAFGPTLNTGYGLHFTVGTPSSFGFFADTFPSPNANNCHRLPSGGASAPNAIAGNCVYDGSFGELVQTYTFGNGITIKDFCTNVAGGWSCTYAHGTYPGGVTSLDIVFSRPNPDPFMSENGVYSMLPELSVTAACLTLTAPEGGEKYVSITSSGRITPNAASCP